MKKYIKHLVCLLVFAGCVVPIWAQQWGGSVQGLVGLGGNASQIGVGLELMYRRSLGEQLGLGVGGAVRINDEDLQTELYLSGDFIVTTIESGGVAIRPYIGGNLGSFTNIIDEEIGLLIRPKGGIILTYNWLSVFADFQLGIGLPTDNSFIGLNVGLLLGRF